jgi:NIMA (never in mitosis gene a)-related kinase
VEPESVSTLSDQDRYLSPNNHRALNPSISGTEQSSQYSIQRAQGLSNCSEEKLYDLSAGVGRDHCNTNKSKAIKSSTGERTPRLRVAKESASARRQTTAPPKIYVAGSKRESVS